MNRPMTTRWRPDRRSARACAALWVSLVLAAGTAQAAAAAQNGATLLERDARLQQRVTLVTPGITMREALRALARQSRVRLTVLDSEMSSIKLSSSFKEAPLRDVMDALGALYVLRWVKDRRGAYVLEPDDSASDFHLPQNQWQEQRYQAGLDFAARVQALPPQARHALAGDEGVEYTDLPPAMRAGVRRMLESRIAEDAAKERTSPLSVESLDGATVHFNEEPGNGFTSYRVSVGNERGNMGWRFNDFAQRRRARAAAAPANSYTPAANRADREQIAADPRLQRKVTLALRDATVGETLHALAEAAGVGFTAQSHRAMSRRKSISFNGVPLRQALDQMAASRPGFFWECRKSGNLVVRWAPKPGTLSTD